MDGVFAHVVFADYGGDLVRRAPFAAEAVVVEGVRGLRVRLPLTGAEAVADVVRTTAAIGRVADALQAMGVEVALWPEGFEGMAAEAVAARGIALARRADAWPFLLPRAVKKALAALGKEAARCEIAVMGADADLLVCVLEEVCHEVNFLTVVTQGEGGDSRLTAAVERIYEETGLEIVTTNDVRQALARADVVVHVSPPENGYATAYRHEAICFDLSGSRGMTAALLARRADMLAADGLYASLGRTTFPQDVLALVLYGKSAAFARMVCAGYHAAVAQEVRADLARLRVTVAAYAQAGRALSVAGLARQRMRR